MDPPWVVCAVVDALRAWEHRTSEPPGRLRFDRRRRRAPRTVHGCTHPDNDTDISGLTVLCAVKVRGVTGEGHLNRATARPHRTGKRGSLAVASSNVIEKPKARDSEAGHNRVGQSRNSVTSRGGFPTQRYGRPHFRHT